MLVADLGLEIAITWEIFKHEFNEVPPALLSPCCAGGEGMRIFGLGSRRNVSD